MRIKNIVKVMNMQALIRVEASKRLASKYIMLENELASMINHIVNNRNMKDYKSVFQVLGKKELDILIGSDYGFCGSYNFQISRIIQSRKKSDKIVIGKKIERAWDGMILTMKKEEFDDRVHEIEDLVEDALYNKKYSKINVIYYRYNKVGDLSLTKKQIFPMNLDISGESKDDFIYDGDIKDILRGMVNTYLKYEIIISCINSRASENIMRQENTSQSLKKIDEVEAEKKVEERKDKKKKEFGKISGNFLKLKNM